MAFGGGFGGFGSTNNQSNTAFGGFGSSNPGTGFGQTATSGFGNNTGTTGTGFGGGGTAFGSTQSAFNTSKTFGNTNNNTGGGIFGNNASTSGNSSFGGFGGNANTTGGFGGATASNGNNVFGGGAKPGFGGGTNNSSVTLFGGSSASGGGFGGATGTPGLFGGAQNNTLANNTQECQGTGSTAFTAFTEKEANTQVTCHYQSITFMQPYQKWSFEELRLADYTAGRKYGNGSNQAGAFGANTGFGGFGQTNPASTGTGFGGGSTGLFGQQNNSTPAFGNTTQSTGAFGGGGNLFGQQNKPAGGLFATNATTSAAAGGSLFSTAGATGFNSQQSTGFSGGSTLFGGGQNQQKQGTLNFGQSNAGATGPTFGGFGGTSNATGGAFNSAQPQNSGNTIFGNNQQQPGTGMFGQQNQTQAQGTTFAAYGGFGQNNQQKPPLFGNSGNTSGGGVFGQNQANQPQQTGNNLFNTPSNAGGNIFGQKAAQPTNSIFGQPAGNTTGGGLFGGAAQNQQQQNSGNGLFGTVNTAGNSLFGPKAAQGGNNLFNTNQQQPQTNPLFGSQNNQVQGSGFQFPGNSSASNIFGNQQNDLQGPPALTASASDMHPYGSASIFSGLPPPSQQSPGPIATPISAGQKQKKPAALPQFKINPAMASRFSTPQKRGYGFTYSSYGTPSSVSSAASTPGGLSSSLLQNSLGRNLGKSLSTSNLRGTFDTDGDSILTPGAFSANSNRYGTGSLKRLHIDRSLRTDLFGSNAVAALPAPERSEPSRSPSIKKKVSFDASTVGGIHSTIDGSTEAENLNANVQDPGVMRSRSNGAGNTQRNGLGSPAKDVNQSNELTTVHEDGSPQASSSNALVLRDQADPELGKYWTKPPLAEIKQWPREKLRAVVGFEVGRECGGYVHFEEPVDLTTVDLDSICGTVVRIDLRSLTVYPTNVSKPPVGQGLNVSSVITLENSWPRQRDKKTPLFEKSGPRFDKHVKRLAAVVDTEFIAYSSETGEWTFRVPHFTTYGLDYDDDEMTEQSDIDIIDSSVLSEAKSLPTPTPTRHVSQATVDQDGNAGSPVAVSDGSQDSSQLDDTFQFKKQHLPPGAFDETLPYDEEVEMAEISTNGQSFLGERSAALHSDEEDEQDEPSELPAVTKETFLTFRESPELDNVIDPIGAYPVKDEYQDGLVESVIKTVDFSMDSPRKTLVDHDMDWLEQLQRTISPRKQDRLALRQSQVLGLKDHPINFATTETVQPPEEAEIATSIDLMHSLFGKEQFRRTQQSNMQDSTNPHSKWPYPSPMVPQNEIDMGFDRAFHTSFKPRWSQKHQLTYIAHDAIESSNRDICNMKFERSRDVNNAIFQRQLEQTHIVVEHGLPKAQVSLPKYSNNIPPKVSTKLDANESLLWELASVLFDKDDDALPSGNPSESPSLFELRIRKDKLSCLWAKICEEDANTAVAAADTPEERAIAYLSSNRISDACSALEHGKDYRLATLVAQIEDNPAMREDMAAQIEDWRKLNILSEISDPIRCLYELLAGNTCTAVGKRGPIEDRAETFVIPETFGMDWKRAFGLKLWYGVPAGEPLETAVREFATDLQEVNLQRPLPFFARSSAALPWTDPELKNRVDPSWGLLELYSQRDSSMAARDLADILMPENLVGIPMFHRLSFELYRALKPQFPFHASNALGDQLTVAFATELEATGQWIWAILVLLHLSDSQSRYNAIKSSLARNAGVLHHEDEKPWLLLVDKLKIPECWLWEAMALFARSTQNIGAVTELRYLLKANDVEEAHRMLLETVAPLKIIERDYSGLHEILLSFETKPRNWENGGGLYSDFIKLVQSDLSNKKDRQALVTKLASGLTSNAAGNRLANFQSEIPNGGFLRRVAFRDMGHVVGDLLFTAAGGDAKEQSSILQLPLNPETRAFRARDLSWAYYQRIMGVES